MIHDLGLAACLLNFKFLRVLVSFDCSYTNVQKNQPTLVTSWETHTQTAGAIYGWTSSHQPYHIPAALCDHAPHPGSLVNMLTPAIPHPGSLVWRRCAKIFWFESSYWRQRLCFESILQQLMIFWGFSLFDRCAYYVYVSLLTLLFDRCTLCVCSSTYIVVCLFTQCEKQMEYLLILITMVTDFYLHLWVYFAPPDSSQTIPLQ